MAGVHQGSSLGPLNDISDLATVVDCRSLVVFHRSAASLLRHYQDLIK